MATLESLLTPLEEGPYSYTDVLADGNTATFTFAFTGIGLGYIRQSDIRPFLRDSDPTSETYNSYTEMQYADYPWTISGTQIIFDSNAPATQDNEKNIRIRRIMPKSSAYISTNTKDIFKEDIINNSFLQQLYSQHEVLDGFTTTSEAQNDLDMGLYRIVRLSPANTDSGATTLSQVREEIDERAATAVAEGVADLTQDIADDVTAAAQSASDAATAQGAAESALSDAEQAVADAQVVLGNTQNVYQQAQDLSDSYVLKTDTSDTGGMLVPSGGSSEQPTDVVPWMRYNTELKRYEAYYPDTGLVGELGGGALKFSLNANTSITVGNGDAFILNVANEVNRTVTVPDTFNDSEYFGICIVGVPYDSSVVVNLQLTGEYFYLEDGATYDSVPLDLNGTFVFQKQGGLWYITQASPVDGDFADALERLEALEDNEVELYHDAVQDTTVPLDYPIEGFSKVRVKLQYVSGSTTWYQFMTVEVEALTSASATSRVELLNISDAGSSAYFVRIWVNGASGTSISLGTNANTYTSPGVVKVVGIRK